MLIDRPQIVEGSVIVNPTVPSGTVDPTNPSVGELFFRTDLNELRVFTTNSTWDTMASSDGLGAHSADVSLHLTSAQNTLLDGLSSSLTSNEINQLVGVTSPIQTQISSHVSNQAAHLSADQNTLLDAINYSTVTGSVLNSVPGHISDSTIHVTSSQRTFLDSLTVTASEVNAVASINSNVGALSGTVSSHIADTGLHLTSLENNFLDAINLSIVGSSDINVLANLSSYLAGQGLNSLSSFLSGLSTTVSAGRVSKTGDTMTGNLVMSNGSTITGVPIPTNDTDVVNKVYVDSLANGIDWKQAVKAASTSAITLSGLQTIDDVVLQAGDRVLVKDQASSSENGVYVVGTGAWSRANDYNSALEISQSAVYVLSGGTMNGKGSFVQTANITTVGTDPIIFTPFSGPVVNTAGNGISLATNGTVSAKVGAGLTFDGSGNIIANLLSNGGISLSGSQLQLTDVGTAGTYKIVVTDSKGRVVSGSNPTTLSGYGITDAVLKSGDTMTGNLGIGITPTSKLHVAGDIQLENAYWIKSKALSGTSTRILGVTSADALYIGAMDVSSPGLFYVNNGTTQFTIDSSGNAALGRAGNPTSAKLYVAAGYGEGDSASVSGEVFRLQRNSSFNQDAMMTVLSGSSGTAGITFGDNGGASMGYLKYLNSSDSMILGTSSTDRLKLDSSGNVIIGTAALSTSATNGFLHIPTMAGAPTGTPSFYTGRVPIVFNTANNALYFYNGSSWTTNSAGAATSVPFTGITGLPTTSTWSSVTGANTTIVGGIAWRNGGNGYSIFDASNTTSIAGAAITSNKDSDNVWTAGSPTLMGLNNSTGQTYGVRVDSARLSDSTSQRTFGNVKTDGISRGTYGSISIAGANTLWAGIDFTATNASFLVKTSDQSSGLFKNDTTWVWGFDGSGALQYGSVPGTLVTGTVNTAASATLANKASTIAQGGANGAAMTFNYSSSPAQPSWIWGTSDGVSNNVFNPALLSVDYASTAGNVSSISNAIGSSYTWTSVQNFKSNANTGAVGVTTTAPLRAYSDNGSGAIMSFQRGSSYAVNMGLDSDNVFRIGGWSAPGNLFALDMAGNLTVGSTNTGTSSASVVNTGASASAAVSFTATSNAGSAALSVYSTTSTASGLAQPSFARLHAGTGLNALVLDSVSGPVVLGTGETEYFRLSASGKIGVNGVVSPSALLHIGNLATSAEGFRISSSAGDTRLSIIARADDTGLNLNIAKDSDGTAAKKLFIQMGGTDRAAIDQSGNVSLGAVSVTDTERLLVQTPLTGTTLGSNPTAKFLSTGSSYDSHIVLGNPTNQVKVGSSPAGAFYVQSSSGTNRMLIDPTNGTVSINTGIAMYSSTVQKLVVGGVVTASSFYESQADLGTASGSVVITLGNSCYTKTISGNTSFTVLGAPNTGVFAGFILELTNGGAYTINWMSGVKWSSGTAPSLTASGKDVLGFYTYDGGGTWVGLVLGKDVK